MEKFWWSKGWEGGHGKDGGIQKSDVEGRIGNIEIGIDCCKKYITYNINRPQTWEV